MFGDICSREDSGSTILKRSSQGPGIVNIIHRQLLVRPELLCGAQQTQPKFILKSYTAVPELPYLTFQGGSRERNKGQTQPGRFGQPGKDPSEEVLNEEVA